MSIDLLGDPLPASLHPARHVDYFSENFWGDKNLGFHVLYHNMKHGQVSVKDLQDFIRESASAEELYAKHMTKLAKQAANCNPLGTFAPLMDVLKSTTEKLSSCHMDIVMKLQDIIKDLSKYLDEQKGKHKQSKDGFTATAEALHNIQTATAAVAKSKEKYNQHCIEEERLKRLATVPPKDLEKASHKTKKACEEYKSQLTKYDAVRETFELKMLESTNEFETIEKAHLNYMKSVLDSYILSFENANVLINQVHQEFRRQTQENSAERLIQIYSEQKGTGTERPSILLFEEFNPATSLPALENGVQNHAGSTENTLSVPPQGKPKKETSLFGGIRRKKAKRNDTSTNSTSSKDSKDAESIESPEKEVENNVDAEGYTIRPETPDRSDKNSFKFSSDSDSDSDSDDPSTRKIQVRIKPKEATDSGGSDLETLNAITKNLTLGSPSPIVGSKKFLPPEPKAKSNNVSPSIPPPSSDKMTNAQLLLLYSAGSDSTNSGSKGSSPDIPTGGGSSMPSKRGSRHSQENTSIKKGPAPPLPPSMSQSASAKSLDDILNMSDISSADINPDIPPPRPPKPAGTLPPLLPQPSTRPNDLTVVNVAKPASQAGTPAHSAPLASSESWSSLSSAGGAGTPGQTVQTPVQNFASFASLSRGPSPLTLSHADPIPIAVAFIETVNAYFKGTDPSKTLTKTTGDMQISFPAGITRAFTSNPNPATLSFQIQCPNKNSIASLLHDKSLLQKDVSVDNHTTHEFNFDMPALVAHVKKMAEREPNSPHYNIRILQYQVTSSHQTMPLLLTSHWKCEPTSTEIKIDYKYNSAATSAVLGSMNVIVPITGSVGNIQSTPQWNDPVWNAAQNRLCWQIRKPLSSESDSGTLESKLTMLSGATKPSALAVQFLSEGSTMSGADFKLVGSGYRISLVKKRFMTGKYLCDSS